MGGMGVARVERRRPVRAVLSRVARALVGLVLGALAAGVEWPVVAVETVLLADGRRPRGAVGRAVAAAVDALVVFERWRMVALYGSVDFPAERLRDQLVASRRTNANTEIRAGDEGAGGAGSRVAGYLFLRPAVGLLGGVVLLLIALGAVGGAEVAVDWIVTGNSEEVGPPEPLVVLYLAVLAPVLLGFAVAGLIGVVVAERWLARTLLTPSPAEAMRRRIEELSTTRAAVVEAVNDEKRRIERDLHDGVQQRLVALGMLLGRARRTDDPAKVDELVAQAHEQSRHALTDLKNVAWWIYPTALDNGGLGAALEAVAERSAVPVRIDCRIDCRTMAGASGRAWEAVAYFVACEAITNATKHANATAITVEIWPDEPFTKTSDAVPMGAVSVGVGGGGRMGVRITDDGCGGADPAGGGLTGLARRVAAVDGVFTVDSPVGGPTVVSAEIPVGM